MEADKKLNGLKVVLLTGLAFVIGGFFRTYLELRFGWGEDVLLNLTIILSGFIVEAMIGFAVLAELLKEVYPFKKLWLAGVGAFAAGVLIPAIFINQFFISLLIFPGILIAIFLALFLRVRIGWKGLVLPIILGFLVCQILWFAVVINDNFLNWIYGNLGESNVTIIMNAIVNFIIGISIASGVLRMLRAIDKERTHSRDL